MVFLKIVAVALFSIISTASSSVIAPALPVAYPAIRYTNVAPPSVLPFSAQVSTFTKNLHVFDAPYAAGVLPGSPAIVQRAILPPSVAPVGPLVPAPFLHSEAPLIHAHGPAAVYPATRSVYPLVNPGYPYVNPLVRSVHAFAPAPLLG